MSMKKVHDIPAIALEDGPLAYPFDDEDEKLLKLLDDKATKNTAASKIQSVPKIFKIGRNNLSQLCRPSEISVGPIHYNKYSLEKDLILKYRLSKKFISDRKEAELLFRAVKREIDSLRSFYDETEIKSFDNDSLARILFLDGCSVLQFIYSSVGDELKEFGISNGQASLIQQDLFKLENQIPFRLLKLLMQSSKKRSEFIRSIYVFISLNIMSPPEYYRKRYKAIVRNSDKTNESNLFDGNRAPLHLLDFLRSEVLDLFGEHDKTTPQKDSDDDKEPGHRVNMNRFDSFHSRYDEEESISKHDETPPGISSRKQSSFNRSFRNVQDLKAVGIQFKSSDNSNFRGISFSRGLFTRPQLKLPPLIVDGSTATKLCNLAAYEMCSDTNSDSGVSSYISFLDSLIDTEQDVRDLRVKLIIRNHLSSDAKVVKLFEDIGSRMISDDAYLSVKMKIQEHFVKKSSTWIAEVCSDHFSSPWKILGLFAAMMVLVLTGTSCWFTAFPRK